MDGGSRHAGLCRRHGAFQTAEFAFQFGELLAHARLIVQLRGSLVPGDRNINVMPDLRPKASFTTALSDTAPQSPLRRGSADCVPIDGL